MSRFYTETEISLGQTLLLDKEESHHLSKVLRLKTGDGIELINGKGVLGKASILETGKEASVSVTSIENDPELASVHIAFGISKSSAVEFLVRRTTEIGVKSLQPLLTQHSLHPDTWNEARWKRLIVEVAKQCELLTFPEILPPKRLKEWLELRDSSRSLVYCYENSRNDQLVLPAGKQADLVIGSEGGFSQEEIALLQQKGALSLGLGKNKLRVETASLVGLVLLKQKLGEI